MSKQSVLAAKRVAQEALKVKVAAALALTAKNEQERKDALVEAEAHAVLVAQLAEEVERAHKFEIAEGERLAKEAGIEAASFWERFKKAVSW
jgi:hypothetical protein